MHSPKSHFDKGIRSISRRMNDTHDPEPLEIVRFLDKAATVTEEDKVKNGIVENPWHLCTVTQVEEVKFVIRVLPIWLSSIMYSTVYSQISTLFIMQGASMDLQMGSIRIPPASLSVFESSSVILWVVIYDRVFVPVLKRYTGPIPPSILKRDR